MFILLTEKSFLSQDAGRKRIAISVGRLVSALLILSFILMKNYQLANHLILRSPVGNAVKYPLAIEAILNDSLFMSALAIASPQFYDRINATAIDERARLTLCRYYNRFCFRATPFGLFASVTPLSWTDQSESKETSALQVYIQPDSYFEYLMRQAAKDKDTAVLEPNPTLYRVQQEYRFVGTETDPVSGKRQYLLQATDFTGLLKRLLRYCEGGCKQQDIRQLIIRESHCSKEEASEYLRFLMDAQVMVPQQRPAITSDGETYLWSNNTIMKLFPLPGNVQALDTEQLLRLQRSAAKLWPHHLPMGQALLNVISIDAGKRPGLNDAHQQALQEGLYALEKLSYVQSVSPLKNFIEQFTQWFEGQQIPLLQVLDPEIGINYGPPEAENDNLLLETINIAPRPVAKDAIHWTPVHQLILNAWHRDGYEMKKQITLTEEDLNFLPGPGIAEHSSGFSVLFRAYGNNVWIESAGGYHTNSLAGRFTPASPEIRDAAKAMAEHEQRLNPDIIFAEILHLTDLHTDNVNKRSTILEWEIPVTAASTLPKKRQLELHDLLVQVINGKVLLSSRKHGKLVIPRLSSAYNHQLNQLPLFRFLADLPYQFGSMLRTLDLPALFPGLCFYPRVVFKRSILSPAQWVISQEHLRSVKEEPGSFRQLQSRLHLPDRFTLTQGDQHLQFDIRSEDELTFFIACIGRSEQIRLQEVLFDPITQKASNDQYNAFVLPEQALNLPLPQIDHAPFERTKRRFMPGSEWLYLKIYTSRLGTNALLRQLGPYLKKQLRANTILKWFFVRYEDHAPHIRVRLLVDAPYLGTVLNDMRALFEHKVERQVIREYQIDTYNRELERYGVADFNEVEDFFHVSSELALSYLNNLGNTIGNEPYLFALVTTMRMGEIAFPHDVERTAYFQRRYLQFSTEFAGDKLHVELDKKYRTLRMTIAAALTDKRYFQKHRLKRLQGIYLQKFHQLIRKAAPDSMHFEQLVSSLIHMHLNRLFTSDSRKQEMIVFYLLAKHLKSMMHNANR